MQAKYSDNVACLKPTNEDAKIWRYMNFTKFVSLLDKNAVFFCRSDKLGDPFEGSYSQANIRRRPIVYQNKIPSGALRTFSVTAEEIRRFIIINCWSLSECESAALWKLYTKNNEGIAIQSTFKRLKQCFASTATEHVFISKVKYINYKRDWLPEGSLFFPFVHKRESFEHEHELRAFIMKHPKPQENGKINFKTAPNVFGNGEFVDVDLNTLIEKVFISPDAQDWFKDLVTSALQKYKYRITPVRSDLNDAPVY